MLTKQSEQNHRTCIVTVVFVEHMQQRRALLDEKKTVAALLGEREDLVEGEVPVAAVGREQVCGILC